MNDRKYRFLSWGLGLQSTYILVMAGLGTIDPIDAAIVADTQWERRNSYITLAFYKQWASDHNIPVIVTTAGNIRKLGAKEHIHIPFFTETGAPLQRQCTNHFKLTPIKQAAREYAGFHKSKPPHPTKGQFEMLIGFSWDEWERISDSRIKFMTNSYPLIEKRINRWDIADKFNELGLPIPGKSACIGCPYRNAAEWQEMKENNPDEFADAVAFDKENRNNPLAIQGNSTANRLYVYKSLIPLDEVDFVEEAKKMKTNKQISLMACIGESCWI